MEGTKWTYNPSLAKMMMVQRDVHILFCSVSGVGEPQMTKNNFDNYNGHSLT